MLNSVSLHFIFAEYMVMVVAWGFALHDILIVTTMHTLDKRVAKEWLIVAHRASYIFKGRQKGAV